jgi:NADPH2:quinone reductase
MKAIVVREFGDPSVLQLAEASDPTPGPDQVLVRLHAAGVNPVEGYVRSGVYASLPALPYTPGTDGAGDVEAVGDGVTGVKVGARVYVAALVPRGSGTYAERVVCRADQVHLLPERLSYAQGAGVGVTYTTAWRAIHQKAHAAPGETILIHGASGGVGVAAVQVARAAGLWVIGTAGSDRGRALVHAQGAQHVFDHHDANYFDAIRNVTDGRGPDIIIEMLANVNLGRDLDLLAAAGRIVIVGSRGDVSISPRAIMSRGATVTGFSLFASTSPAEILQAHAGLGAGFDLGTLTPVVGREFTLADAPRAHQALTEAGAHGKIVLTI